MPKATSARIAEAQQQRHNISKKSEKYGPSTIYLQVLGSGAVGAPNTLYLFTDQKRYLFNCGECTQRLAHEHKVKLSKLDHIFITTKTWKNIGGLPGLSLTLQDVGVPNITLHGPNGLDELYNATKRFVIMNDMNVTMAKCSPSADFEDNVMTVRYVILYPFDRLLNDSLKSSSAKLLHKESNQSTYYQEFLHDTTDYYGRKETQEKNIQVMKPKPTPYKETQEKNIQVMKSKPAAYIDPKRKKSVVNDMDQPTKNCSLAYICTLKKRLGTLDLAKCVELGVKPGPMLGQLKQGQDVVLPDGTLVKSSAVKTPDDPGPIFIVLDVPEISYLRESEFESYYNNGLNPPENVPVLIAHFTPPHVIHDQRYVKFMSMFGPTTRHLLLNSKNSCLGSEAVHRTQHKLHLLDPDIFPLLRDKSLPAMWNSPDRTPAPKSDSNVKLQGLEQLKNKIAIAQFQNIVSLEKSCKGDGLLTLPSNIGENSCQVTVETLAARTLTMFHLRPKVQLDRSAEPKLHIQDYIQEAMDTDGFVTSLENFKRVVDSIRYAKDDVSEFPKVVFLGTGSCIPSKTRNTSAIVLHVNENNTMLLDCGEGTFGQLVRFYGSRKVNAFLRKLKAIYISHLHADHHIGLIGVLQARRQAFKETFEVPVPLYLLAPGQIMSWLTLYDEHFECIKNLFSLLPNQNLLQGEAEASLLAAIGIRKIQTCLVAHCPNAFGVAIELNDRCKITYSGDTLPCQQLVDIGMNSTLLIHEATMEDELVHEARCKMHSTTTQAIDVGKKMNAKFTVLTHFSQRYARLPRLNANILDDNHSVGIAFDNMQITLDDLLLLPYMYAPLQLMFAEHCVEMELKAAHRQRRINSSISYPDSNSHSNEEFTQQTGNKSDVSGRRSPNLDHVFARKEGIDGRKSDVDVPAYRESNTSRLRREMKGMPMSKGAIKAQCLKGRRSVGDFKCHSPPGTNDIAPVTGNSRRNNSRLYLPIAVVNSMPQDLNKRRKPKKVTSQHVLQNSTPLWSCDVSEHLMMPRNLILTPLSISETSDLGTASPKVLRKPRRENSKSSVESNSKRLNVQFDAVDTKSKSVKRTTSTPSKNSPNKRETSPPCKLEASQPSKREVSPPCKQEASPPCKREASPPCKREATSSSSKKLSVKKDASPIPRVKDKHNNVIVDKKPQSPKQGFSKTGLKDKNNNAIVDKKPLSPKQGFSKTGLKDKNNNGIVDKKPQSPKQGFSKTEIKENDVNCNRNNSGQNKTVYFTSMKTPLNVTNQTKCKSGKTNGPPPHEHRKGKQHQANMNRIGNEIIQNSIAFGSSSVPQNKTNALKGTNQPKHNSGKTIAIPKNENSQDKQNGICNKRTERIRRPRPSERANLSQNKTNRSHNSSLSRYEDERKKLMMEAKKKFTSSRFLNDSRFEKIEGLNWISWK